ncbi:MAG: helix-turn-helix transcriptional regulator [Bdellovibrionaceae bacterium]|nr:helix-turn-helix transcriptional regulator [Pseudobdellovibrionaceae bacterium]
MRNIRSLEDIGTIVRQTRKARGLSQEELARISGVGRRFISELEHGKKTMEFGKALHVLKRLGLDLSITSREHHD